MEAARVLRSVPDDAHVAVDVADRSGQVCSLPGEHLVVALAAGDVLTCTNLLPLRRRPRMVFSPVCKAQVVLEESGRPPSRCPRCGAAFVI